jgi:ADP-heptose:LPS heptosyltransferase
MKILLIKRGAIGDLLMATPLVRQLKQQLNCPLDIIVGKSASAALILNPYLDKQFILPD